MKNLLLSAFIFLSLSSFFSLSFTEIISAIQSGNAAEVSKFFDNTVEITLPGKSNSYSKSQAELVLHDFFSINQTKSFQVIHKSDNAGSQYCIGNLNTTTGVFRTTIYMKQKGDRVVVQELRLKNNYTPISSKNDNSLPCSFIKRKNCSLHFIILFDALQ